ncbi:MAG: type II secretion system major pseudopilin GspG [Chromatiales bacterium]
MKHHTGHRSPRGFTLIELLVVLVILGLLASLVGPRVMNYLIEAKSDSAHLQIENLAATLNMYRLGIGRYPTSDEGLDALVEAPAGTERWNGPYLDKKQVPKDPWGFDYQYRFPGEHGDFDLYTLGADNAEGGEGEDRDIANWH